MDLRAQIVDNIRALCPGFPDPIITLAEHDHLWWVIIFHLSCSEDRIRSAQGSKTREAAMENMSPYHEQELWQKLKEEGVSLAKRFG